MKPSGALRDAVADPAPIGGAEKGGPMKRLKRAAVAVLAAGALLLGGSALAHTYGPQTISALAYAPIANGYFTGTADTDCTYGTYGSHSGNNCITSVRTVEVRAQAKKCLQMSGGNCVQWSGWQDSSPALTKNCNVVNAHCQGNATTLTIDSSCTGSISQPRQYRTYTRARYKYANGTWSPWSAKGGNPVLWTVCDNL